MFGYSTGLSALASARMALQTIGHNLANATTPGYSRQRVDLASAAAARTGNRLIGGGVMVAGLQRVSDSLLVGQVRLQQQAVGRRQAIVNSMMEIESLYGEPGENGFSARLGGFFDGLSSLSSTPEDTTLRVGVVQNGVTMSGRLRQIRDDLSRSAEFVADMGEAVVSEVNLLTESLAEINREIARSGGNSGGAPAGLLDRQGQLLESLSELVDVGVLDVGGGRVNVTVGGQMVVSNDRANHLSISRTATGMKVDLEGSPYDVEIGGGQLRGLLDLDDGGASARVAELDEYARSLIFNFNRIHSTGVPTDGGYQTLRAEHTFLDSDGDGDVSDELLKDAGLPFEIVNGRLAVSVIDDATQHVTQKVLDIDPATDTVADLMASFNSVDGMSAHMDTSGKLTLSADSGKRFHFAASIDPNPASAGTFGSSSGQIVGFGSAPFSLTAGDQIQVAVDGGAPQPITFNAGDFADISAATAEEVAAVLNTGLTGGSASVVNGAVVVTSNTTGSTSSIQVTDAIGLSTGTLGFSTAMDTGAATAVAVTASGDYSGAADDTYTFRPLSAGTIGVTPGLQIEVLDSAGSVVATLDVGDTYSPGTELPVAAGVKLAFGPGEINQASGDVFKMELVADSDTSDILVSLGLGGFFTGTDAQDIDVHDGLVADPTLLAAAASDSPGDNTNLLRLLGLRSGGLDDLGGSSLEEHYNSIVGNVGMETSRAMLNRDTEALLLDSVQNRLEQVRGVSVDEELADLQRFEQAYQAAARYLAAVNEVTQVLFSI